MVRNDLKVYDTHAESWWDGSQGFLRSLHNLVYPRLAYIKDIEGGWGGLDVLDLGCGGGFMSEALAKSGARVVGVDPSEQVIQAATEHSNSQGLDITYKVGVGEAIPLADASLDRVICVDVLEHVTSPSAVIQEVRRVLKPGGRFVFDTLNRNPFATFLLVTLAEDVLGLVPRGVHDPKMFIKPKELRSMLKDAGFKPAPFVGLGPTGINLKGELRFGRLPVTWAMYLGHADLPL